MKLDPTALSFFQHVNWRPDARELRRFAGAMLIGFSLLGLLVAWRGGGLRTASVMLWSIGLTLAIAAFIPKVGRIVYLAVYLPASVVGYVVSQIIMTLIFFLVFTPLGIILRLIGKDPLRQRRPRKKTQWAHVKRIKSEDSYYRQF